ncbi:excinuclease ABC subunit C [Bowdeniella nasicola]|uniref:UvrABC system protein C n=1 Tax=Bowdeniella nasicola TaxID=208480 RepID=A0A1Q5Q1F9_9ACTO|nr:excinuclease ABC subunit UvrC [Bowdeniella nasicola]OKL53703.1 excinuclease ABC subunit C [Bowdeniella nasicola]
MPDPATYRPKPSHIPTSPGVYRFSDGDGRVLYVGKAKNLRARLSSYFQDPSGLNPRIRTMVCSASAVKWTVVTSEIEALTLEYAWIKEFEPRFNVMYRDDKSYPYLAVSLSEQVPRVYVTRQAKRRGTRYFGPYTKVWAVRETLDMLLRVFPVRTCTAGVYRRAEASGRPCLLGYINKCSAPCVGRISPDDHRALVDSLCDFMAGRTQGITERLHAEMLEAAAAEEFEKAAARRDDLTALATVAEKNTLVLAENVDADVYALEVDELEAAVQVFYVRAGRVRGHRGWVTDRIDDAEPAELIERLLTQLYGERADLAIGKGAKRRTKRSVDDVDHLSIDAIPPEILVPVLPTDPATMTRWLGELRGAKVRLRVPERGPKRTLMNTVHANAEAALKLHRTKRAGDLTARSAALEELQENLGLDEAPLRIECFDVSHTQGTNQVASMVVFEDAAPRKADYRHFIIRGEHGDGASDDTAAMSEVLRRRFARLACTATDEDAEADDVPTSGAVDPDTGRPQRFAYRPQLVVVDGGLPQVNAAQRTLDELGVDIPVVGLAKRLEEVWIPGDHFPLILPRTSSALYLLQHLRDESHRFAISFHRKRRSGAMTRSALDSIPGLGPARQAALLKHFGSVKAIRAASPEDLQQVDGVGPALAAAIAAALRTAP